MKERFEGPENRTRLVQALQRQNFAAARADVATALADAGEITEFNVDDVLIAQESGTNDIFLILAGEVAIMVNGAHVANRSANDHIGEMAAIDASLPRAATVKALVKTVALKLSSDAFMMIGEAYPTIWLPIAQELSRRLYNRNAQIFAPNDASKLFIISSSEAMGVADALRAGLEKDVFSKVWSQGTFFAGGYTIEALEQEIIDADFAVAIAEPDDITRSRGSTALTVRDNVLFELGLFMGGLSRFRSILVHPKVKDLKLPSDLQGLTCVSYEPGDAATVDARMASVCDKIREVVKRLGPKTFNERNR